MWEAVVSWMDIYLLVDPGKMEERYVARCHRGEIAAVAWISRAGRSSGIRSVARYRVWDSS